MTWKGGEGKDRHPGVGILKDGSNTQQWICGKGGVFECLRKHWLRDTGTPTGGDSCGLCLGGEEHTRCEEES